MENVVTNQKPEVFGTARKMDRTNLKSLYCSCKATIQFRKLIQDIRAKYIIVSYNNTGDKINSRSNAKISDKEIIEILKQKEKFQFMKQNLMLLQQENLILKDTKKGYSFVKLAKNRKIHQ